MVSGFSVHANVCIEARDRMRLERLIRYAARPAVSSRPSGGSARTLQRQFRSFLGKTPRAVLRDIRFECARRELLEETGYRKMLEDENSEEARTRLANIDELLNAASDAAERGGDGDLRRLVDGDVDATRRRA
jgi:AraC-like DNA-binding protein